MAIRKFGPAVDIQCRQSFKCHATTTVHQVHSKDFCLVNFFCFWMSISAKRDSPYYASTFIYLNIILNKLENVKIYLVNCCQFGAILFLWILVIIKCKHDS